MPGMDIARTKIPFLPPEWTVGRGLKCAAKLGAFILVPGLHQAACNRRILGGLLFVIYLVSEITLSHWPWNYSSPPFTAFELAKNLGWVSLYFSWLLLAMEVRRVEGRKLKLNAITVLSVVVGLYFVPQHDAGDLNIFVERNNYVCPAFCEGDIVEYELFDGRVHNISPGDHVIREIYAKDQYVAKIMAGPPALSCAGEAPMLVRLPPDHFYCEKDELANSVLKYIIHGGPEQIFVSLDGIRFTLTNDGQIWGYKPKKVGNIKDFYLFSDGITNAIGQALLFIYQLMGINLFEKLNKS